MKHFKNYSLLSRMIALFFILSSLSVFAHFGSKGPYGGATTCSLVYDTTVYIGTENGGVFESTSRKLVGWRPRPVGLKSGKITALARSGNYLYAATADSGIFIFTGFVGSDRYWKKINNGLGNLKVKSLLALDSVTVLAGTDGDGIYRTIDKGASWTKISNATLNNSVITGLVKGGNGRIFLTALNTGVFMSENKGDTWTDFNDVNTLNITGTSTLSYNELAHELMVINSKGILSTTVAAANPVASYSLFTTGLPANTTVRSIFNDVSRWIIATDKGVFIRYQNLLEWKGENTGLSTLNATTAIIFQNIAVTGTKEEGIFKTPLPVVSWAPVNFGYNNLVTYSMACNGPTVVVAATEKGVFVSKDLASNYKLSNKGLTDSLNVTDLVFFGTKLLAATKHAGVFISADTGASWTLFNSGLMTQNVKKLVSSSSYIYLITADNEVFVSQGLGWFLVNNGLPSGVKPTSFVFYGNKVALGTYGNGIYTALAGKNSWTAFNTGLTNLKVTSLAAQRLKLFAGTDGNGVFVSDTATAAWTTTAATTISHTTLMGLNGNSIEAMATYAGYVWASYKGGLLATSDYGTTWIAGGNQFNLPSYTHVTKIDFVTTRVFVTTENNGLYSNALSELPIISGIDAVATTNDHFTIYPNPSNGLIKVDLKANGNNVQQVIVYDLTGKKITSVRPDNSLPLELQLQVAPGIYFVQVIANQRIATQKIVIE